MSELLGWYIEELRLLIGLKLPTDKVQTILQEAKSHLQESATHRMAGLATERVAMVAAINAYGSPKKIAISYLKRSPRKLFGLPPVYSAVGGALIAICCWNFHWLTLSGFFDNFGDARQNEVAGLVGIGGLCLMVLACRAAYRSFRLPVVLATVATAGLSVPIISFWMVGGTADCQGISRLHLARDTKSVKGLIGKIDRYEAMLREGMDAYSKANSRADVSKDWLEGRGLSFDAQGKLVQKSNSSQASSKPGWTLVETPDEWDLLTFNEAMALPRELRDASLAATVLGEKRFNPAVVGSGIRLDRGGRFIVPRMFGSFAQVDGTVTVFETMQHYAEAEKAWKQYGPTDLHQLEEKRIGMVGLLKSAQEAQNGRLFFFNPALYQQTLIGTLILIPLFFLVDCLGALSAMPRRTWPKQQVA